MVITGVPARDMAVRITGRTTTGIITDIIIMEGTDIIADKNRYKAAVLLKDPG